MHARRSRRLVTLAAALALLPLFAGCFTTHVWGGTMEDDDGDGVYDAAFDSDDHRGGELDLPSRFLLTPFTLLLDLCTMPIQACLYGWEDDEDDCD